MRLFEGAKLPMRFSSANGVVQITPTIEDIDEAQARFSRYKPVLEALFGELVPGGVIESPLASAGTPGIYVKNDCELPIYGAIESRGGIYEMMLHTELVAFFNGFITGPDDDFMKLLEPNTRQFFAGTSVEIGADGPLDCATAIVAKALGFESVAYLGCDASDAKRRTLEGFGVHIEECGGELNARVAARKQETADVLEIHFVDDVASLDIFMGASVAARNLRRQLDEAGIQIGGGKDESRLVVHLPQSAKLASAGVAFGLKCEFGDDVECVAQDTTAEAAKSLISTLKDDAMADNVIHVIWMTKGE